jgi:thioredoxin reductase (NADPH)
MQDILIYSTAACPYCIVAKRALDNAGIPYREIDITRTPEVRNELHAKTGERTVPQVFVDGVYIGQDDELVEMVQSGKLRADDTAEEGANDDDEADSQDSGPTIDVAIIGAGWSGLTLARNLPKNLNVTLFDRAPHVDGLRPDRDQLRQTLADRGARFIEREVFGVEQSPAGHALITLDGPINTRTVVVASGARGHGANIPGETHLMGKGVSTCAECDGAFFVGSTVAVAGNDERALKGVFVLAEKAKAVHLLCPKEALFAGADSLSKLARLNNVTLHLNTRILEIDGTTQVAGAQIDEAGQQSTLPLDGVFIYLDGTTPSTGFLKGMLATDDNGAISVSGPGQSSVQGIFAAGPASTVAGAAPPYQALADLIAENLG